jgi:hypothetical protein
VTEKFKVLSAMVALDDFTPHELARFSGVKISTVRTVVARNGRFLEDLGQIETGRRGGQPTRSRLTPEGRATIRKELDETYAAITSPAAKNANPIRSALNYLLGDSPETRVETAPELSADAPLPLGLVAANDTLKRLESAATPGEQTRILQLAERQVRSARNVAAGGPAQQRLRAAIDSKLAEIEQRRIALSHGKSSGALKPLEKFRLLTRTACPPHDTTQRLQIWTDATAVGTPELQMRVKDALAGGGAEILVSAVPPDPASAPPIKDALILIVDSSRPEATKHFRNAYDACLKVQGQLIVLDQSYSAGLRSIAVQCERIQYLDHATDLDSAGLQTIVGSAIGKPVKGISSTHLVSQLPAPPIAGHGTHR